eukprot:5523973-Pyramimonas_sp.AAC.1
MSTTYHRMYSFGWETGRRASNSAGCAIFARKRSIRPCHICVLKATPTDLAGKGSILRIKSGTFDMTGIT